MDVEIVIFPETRVAAVEHHGSLALGYDTVRKLIAWKIENRLLDQSKYRSYGVHHTDPRTTPASKHRVDFCLSIEGDVDPNSYGISASTQFFQSKTNCLTSKHTRPSLAVPMKRSIGQCYNTTPNLLQLTSSLRGYAAELGRHMA